MHDNCPHRAGSKSAGVCSAARRFDSNRSAARCSSLFAHAPAGCSVSADRDAVDVASPACFATSPASRSRRPRLPAFCSAGKRDACHPASSRTGSAVPVSLPADCRASSSLEADAGHAARQHPETSRPAQKTTEDHQAADSEVIQPREWHVRHVESGDRFSRRTFLLLRWKRPRRIAEQSLTE